MKYQLCKSPKAARTSDYVGSIKDQNDGDYKRMTENCKRHNKEVRAVSRRYGRVIGELMRVRVMGRGPRVEAAKRFYHSRRAFDSYLPICLAKSFDVYYGVDNTAMYDLKRELDTGMTPGEMRKHDQLKYMAMMIEMKGKMRKRSKK